MRQGLLHGIGQGCGRLETFAARCAQATWSAFLDGAAAYSFSLTGPHPQPLPPEAAETLDEMIARLRAEGERRKFPGGMV